MNTAISLLIIGASFFAVTSLFLFTHWFTCRLTARRCPRCESRWRTELIGEYGGEHWQCHTCGHYWEI